jgi:hypothetical protein
MASAQSIRDRILAASPEELRAARQRFDPVTWALESARIMLPKGAFGFKGREFMVPVYRDLHNEIVIIKGAQMGFSTMSIIRTLWALTTFPMSVIYTFPTKGDVSTFTAARINPIIESSPYLKERIQNFDSVGMKQFARVSREEQRRMAALGMATQYSTVYFNGAQNPKDATSVDADLLIHDEEDRSDPQTIEEYQSRLFASNYKWLIRLSTPTYPGAGIDRQWKRSDMRRWLVKCSGCNERFEMDYPRNIEPETYPEVLAGKPARYKCHVCNKTLSEEDRMNGIWVPERPNYPVHGYSINQMAASWVSATTILEQEHRATFKGAFWNLVMARPYQEGTSAMTREAILARQDESVVGVGQVQARKTAGSEGKACTMGVDVGKFLDVTIGTTDRGRPRIIEFKRLTGDSKWDDLSQLMTLYSVVNCVVDADPEDHMAHVFARQWPGRVWRCRYSHGRVKDVRFDDTTMQVTPPRTEILTQSSHEILTSRILPKYDGSEEYDAFINHHVNSKKVPIFTGIESVDQFSESVDNERGISHYEWRETGPDHFFHSGTYEMLARMGYTTVAGLPSVGLIGLNRYEAELKNAQQALGPTQVTSPLLLPSGIRRAKRRQY